MDPLTQGVLGAALPQSLPQSLSRSKSSVFFAGIAGFFGGVIPDLDILIRSKNDPLLFLEFHRQFTHSLIFIPVGGLIAALILFPFLKKHLGFKKIYLFATLGYATHGLLDACTSYGTQLFWPFSDARIAWNNVSVVDPLFTLPLLSMVLLTFWMKHRFWARLGLIYAFFYLTMGWLQHDRAISAAYELARSRGHSPLRLEAKPTFGNLLLWKTVYEYENQFYVDGLRIAKKTLYFQGSSIQKLNLQQDLPYLDSTSTQYQDIKRFDWFSKGYIALHPKKENVIGDVRYSFLPHEIDPMWGIELDTDRPDQHAQYRTFRESAREKTSVFWKMLKN
jgi:inner membrane protein